jgi:RNA polymerase sigma-70 factor, ECF subfamily
LSRNSGGFGVRNQATCPKTITLLFCFAVNDLIEQLKRGSQEAFQALVAQCSHNVISTCFGLLDNMEDAEDMAQDVFIEVYKSVHRFRKESDLNTWIYRIAINKSLDLLRKRKRKKRFGDLRALFHAKAKPADSPHQRLEEAERKEILQQQIGLLAENQRIALVLSQYEKLSNKQIATIMGTSEAAAESLLHRARANLRKHLTVYFEKKGEPPAG